MDTIKLSVGALGVNSAPDVLTIQKLINLSIGCIIPRAPLPESGTCDEMMISAIMDYQTRVVRASRPDGRVDPGGATMVALNTTASGKIYTPKSATPTAGKKYTDSPNEVPVKNTKPSAAEVVAMVKASWTDLTENGGRTLASQYMAETGGGANCYNWNLGNVKASASEQHMYLHGVWECASETAANTAVEKSGGNAHIATVDEAKKHGWSCSNQTIVVFDPPHPASRFRAYDSLSDGAQKWIKHHQAIAAKDSTYLTSLNGGDTAAVAKALKNVRYYSAPEANYASGMAR